MQSETETKSCVMNIDFELFEFVSDTNYCKLNIEIPNASSADSIQVFLNAKKA